MSIRTRQSFRIVAAAILAFAAARGSLPGQSADKVKNLFTKIQWRGVGPAVMGGRTVDIDVVESRPSTIYAAIGPSGVWKTENNGVTWAPVFFKEATVSVGDIAVAQADPSVVWVGTGEATCRNSVTIGDGVYKSVDAGKTWTNMGLRDTRHISRIIVNRGDPNIVLVAAMGHLWGANPDRGVFRTIDGGKTWAKTLYINDNTGIADLAQDPANSLVLYAAAYEYRRWAYDYMSGGPGSGLFKSVDGGATWQRLSKDLPQGTMGRIGIATAPGKPGIVYALIEHLEGGIWRSEDYGETWKRTCDTPTFKRVNSRPFYYSQIHVDPSDDKTLYVLSSGLHVSNDMGRKFRAIGSGIHPDHHGFWIDPADPLHLIDGNDGGIDMSYDGGKTWLQIQSMDLAEVYQVGFDLRRPYWVYCGLQDNGVWGAPNASMDPRGIPNEEWAMVGGGDGFYVVPDPSDPDTVYSNSQMNGLQRLDQRIWRAKSVRPTASLKTPPYRFNWNSPIAVSPHDPKTVYCGGNFLFRTTDGGGAWEAISPDLTTNDPARQKDAGGPISFENSGAEVHCTIVTISASPASRDVIWCGTDDGNLQLTRDGGKTWANVVSAIPGLPKKTWCSRVEASRFDAGTAYASFDGHRADDYGAYLYKTSDFGKTWKSLRANLPFGWVHVVREGLKNRNLLFAGMEFGVFASLDGGASWFSLMNNLPTVAVNDIAVHPRENDLIIGTHGRGVWIMDDVGFLEEMSEDVLARDYHLFPSRPAVMYWTAVKGEPYGKPVFMGKNPAAGGFITTWLKSEIKDKAKLIIKDSDGKSVSEMNLAQGAGIQRDIWNLQLVPESPDGKKYPPAGSIVAALPNVKPGTYALEIEAPGARQTGTIEVLEDPRFTFSEDQWVLQTEAIGEVLLISKRMALSITAAKSIRRHIDAVNPDLDKLGEKGNDVRSILEPFLKSFSKIESAIVPGDFGGLDKTLEGALRGGSLSIQMLIMGSSIASFPQAPTAIEKAGIRELAEIVDNAVSSLNALIANDIPRLDEAFKANGLKPFPAMTEIK